MRRELRWRGLVQVGVRWRGGCACCALNVLLHVEHVLTNFQNCSTRARARGSSTHAPALPMMLKRALQAPTNPQRLHVRNHMPTLAALGIVLPGLALHGLASFLMCLALVWCAALRCADVAACRQGSSPQTCRRSRNSLRHSKQNALVPRRMHRGVVGERTDAPE